jgi:hypothetical protein
MPSLKELLTQHNVTLPDGVNLADLVEQSDEVRGLKTTKDELLNWKVTNKPLLESLAAEKDLLATKAKEEEEKALRLAQENGDFKTAAEITANRLKSLEDGLSASREKAKQSAHEAALQSVASLFGDKSLGMDIAATKVVTTLTETGDTVVSYKMGNETFADLDTFKGALSKVPSYANMMPVGGESNTPASNGQGSGGGAQPVHKNKAAETAKSKGDATGFLAAHLSS